MRAGRTQRPDNCAMKTSILLCIALISASSVAYANDGTVRFSGRVVDPGCHASVSNTSQELSLDACPASAKGARIHATSLTTDGAVHAHQFSLAAVDLRPGDLSFSERHRLGGSQQQSLRGAYLVVVDYP